MQQALVVEFRIRQEHVEAFAREIIDNARASRDTEAGCRQFDVCRDPAEPCVFFLYERYDDEAAVQAHLASSHYLQMSARSAGWVEKKTVWRYRRIAP